MTDSQTDKKRVSIKFAFKNEVEHTYVLEIANDDIANLQDFLCKAVKNDWMVIPDPNTKGRICFINTAELVCFQTTM
jgi:hypothetical protein